MEDHLPFSLMWEMFDTDFDCGTECGGPGPPPKFLLPPPPRPPFMQDLQDTQCSEDPIHDGDVCDAIPVSSPLIMIKVHVKEKSHGRKLIVFAEVRRWKVFSAYCIVSEAEWEWPLIKTSNVARLLSSLLFDNISMDGLLRSQPRLPRILKSLQS